MKNIKWIIIFIIFLLDTSFKQKNDDIIIWNKNTKLQWTDFIATADEKTDITRAAISSCNIKYTIYNSTDDTLYFRVYALFFRNESWKDPYSKHSGFGLQHEQTHFDITELFARKYRKSLISLKMRHGDEYKIIELFRKIKDEWNAYQDAYDNETNHSLRESKQEEWNKKVAEELKTLEAYSSKDLRLPLVK